jgi:hypothetical protein
VEKLQAVFATLFTTPAPSTDSLEQADSADAGQASAAAGADGPDGIAGDGAADGGPADGGGAAGGGTGDGVPAGSPVISSLVPDQGPAGTEVQIHGANLGPVTRVSFGAYDAASFTPVSHSQVTAVVPPMAVTGPVTLHGPEQVSSTQDFTVDLTAEDS